MGIYQLTASDEEKAEKHRDRVARFFVKVGNAGQELTKLVTCLDALRKALAADGSPSVGNTRFSALKQAANPVFRGMRDLGKLVLGYHDWVRYNDTVLKRAVSRADFFQGRTTVITTLSEMEETCRNLELELTIVVEEYRQLLDKLTMAKPSWLVTNTQMTDQMNPSENVLPDSLPDFNASSFQQFSGFDNDMPGRGGDDPSPVMLLELPILPTFNRPCSSQELLDRGFSNVPMAGYFVIESAYIMAVNVARCHVLNLNPLTAVRGWLRALSEGLNEELVLICEKPAAYYKGGWLYFWYGSTGSLHGLQGSRGRPNLWATSFAFPFGK